MLFDLHSAKIAKKNNMMPKIYNKVCSPSRGHRPSRPGVWIGYRRCGGRRNDSLRHQNHGGGERYPGRAR